MRLYLYGLIGWVLLSAQMAYGVSPTAPDIEHKVTRVLAVEMKGPIGEGTKHLMKEFFQQTEAGNYDIAVIELYTPGGLYSATRDMVQSILAAPFPVVIYVSPSGAHAASAGFFLLYAADIAAMAPATNVGSATPVDLMGGDVDTNMKAKILNDTLAFIRGLAEENGRNKKLAEKGVSEALNFTANEALEKGVVNVVAPTLEALIPKLNGMDVTVGGKRSSLIIDQVEIDRASVSMKTQLIMLLTDPNLIYYLLMIGLYGILFELYSPGGFVSGVIGVVCLGAALWSLAVLPTNLYGILLIVLGMILLMSEMYIFSFGLLGLGGVLAIGSGSYMLFDHPAFAVDMVSMIIIMGFTFMVLGVFCIHYMMKMQKKEDVISQHPMVGQTVTVVSWEGKHGTVSYQHQIWQAVKISKDTRIMAPGTEFLVKEMDGIVVKI